MKSIYCISGLGADSSIFKNVAVEGATLHHVHWAPLDKDETVASYARKLSSQVPDDVYLIGLSFGGMLAVEMAKRKPLKKVVIISSAKQRREIPDFNSILTWFITHRLVPHFLFTNANKYVFEYFGAESEDEKELLRNIFNNSDGQFMSRAMRMVTLWNNTVVPPCIIHIHGTADRIIPPGLIKPDYWIKGGTHIMIYNRATEINKILNDIIV
ncbi:MAG: alpha/beta hydrolase [Sphingobacteriales bacterium]|nr:MAG: alpha/beta hydrolase [Sphingobacteriales bacterium]